MSLIDAPAYDPTHDNRVRNLWIAGSVLVAVLLLTALAGRATGHGWLFTNMTAEHRVDQFLTAVQDKDFQKAYQIYNNSTAPNPDYPMKQFVEDWTTYSPVHGPILSHHVDVSGADGTGIIGSTVIVGVHLNGVNKVFFEYTRKDGTLTCCTTTHIIQYN